MKLIKVSKPVVNVNNVPMMVDILDYFRDFCEPPLSQEAIEAESSIWDYCLDLKSQGKIGRYDDYFETTVSEYDEEVKIYSGWQCELIDESLTFPFPPMVKWFDLMAADPRVIEQPKVEILSNQSFIE